MNREYRNNEFYQDLKFCCDEGALSFREYVDSVLGNKSNNILHPSRIAFVAMAVPLNLVSHAQEAFGARLVTAEDEQEYHSEVTKAQTLGERAKIALAWRVCEFHQEQDDKN